MPQTTFPAPQGDLPAYVATPTTAGPWPAVVVVHEIFGLTDDIRQSADRLAALGYLALAPQLFARQVKPLCLVTTFRALLAGKGTAVEDLKAARDHLRGRDDTTGKVGIIGFCMGGGFALLLSPEFDVAAPNYGPPPKDLALLESSCPVVASYGGRDRGIPESAVQGLEDAWTRGGVEHELKVYPGAGHSFMNRDALGLAGPVLERVAGVGYRHADAEDAWRRISTFFATHLAD